MFETLLPLIGLGLMLILVAPGLAKLKGQPWRLFLVAWLGFAVIAALAFRAGVFPNFG